MVYHSLSLVNKGGTYGVEMSDDCKVAGVSNAGPRVLFGAEESGINQAQAILNYYPNVKRITVFLFT
jgi:hypothetical protein